MTVPMQALKSFPYAGRRLEIGDRFDARGESDARVLEAIRNATRHVQVPEAITDPVLPPIATKRGRGYRKQALEAEASSATAQDSTKPGASEGQPSEDGTGETPGAGSAETPSTAETLPVRRRYQRRDLQAEDQ